MTLVSDIIRDAYRESNLISIGTEPSGAQRSEGLRFINRLVPSILGNEGGEGLTSVYLTELDVAFPNIRVVCDQQTPTTITLPPMLDDGARLAVIDPKNVLGQYPLLLKGGKNQIEGQDFVLLSTSGTSRSYLYRADIGNWERLNELVETDAWPFPTEFDDMFIVSLAFRLNPRYNINSQSESLMTLKRASNQFKARYNQSREIASELGLLNLRNDNSPTVSFTTGTR